MSATDESRDTAALNKTFEDLVLEIEELERIEREKPADDQDQTARFVKVYYINSGRDPTRPSCEDFFKALEGCKNLCDPDKTCVLRGSHPSSDEEAVFLTPKFDPHSKEVAAAEQVCCSLSELRVAPSEHILDYSLQIAKRIQQDYKRFKAFVVLDSFQHMDFVATGVSLLIRNLNKFVIFTGGHLGIELPNSDTNSNLVASLLLAGSLRPSRRLPHPRSDRLARRPPLPSEPDLLHQVRQLLQARVSEPPAAGHRLQLRRRSQLAAHEEAS